MKHEQQVEILKSLLSMIDNKTTLDAGCLVKNPTDSYVSKDLADKEWETMFANHPQVIGISGDLPEPGSFITSNDFGVPILATRDKEGNFHAFVNACRHRGAVLTEEERGKQMRFACPFHAWTYAADGQLLGVREPKKFGDLDKNCHGLVELPAQEKYGLLVVHPQLDGDIDIDALLGDKLAANLESWEIDRGTYLGSQTLDMALNWKIANDTFGENYHFHTLHATQLNNLFYGDATEFIEHGRNHQLMLASRYTDHMRELPEEQWNLTDAGIVVNYLFPNVQLVLFNRIITVVRIYPNRGEVGRCLTRISHYSAQHIGAETAEEAQQLDGKLYEADMSQRLEFDLDTQMELINSTLEKEDYHMGTKSQEAAASGKMEYFVFGRNEPALHHFHDAYRDALGMPPLEKLQTA